MFKLAELMVMQAITPIHAGCGSDLGIVDLPIQREKQSGYPKIESSGIKGCVREAFELSAESAQDVYDVHNLFGYDKNSKNCYTKKDEKKKDQEKIENISENLNKAYKGNDQFAGAIGFTDARILLFPVISARDVFAYVTCPGVIHKFLDELKVCNIANEQEEVFKLEVKEGRALCSCDCKLKIKDNIVIEEYTYLGISSEKTEEVERVKEVDTLVEILAKYTKIEKQKIMDKLIIVEDSDFRDYVTMNTEIITRTKIDHMTGTVKAGALFTEEYLPTETVMYAIVLFSPIFSLIKSEEIKPDENILNANDVKKLFDKKVKKCDVLQIGGGMTIGKGITKIAWGGNAK